MQDSFEQQLEWAIFSNRKKGFRKCPEDRVKYSTLLQWLKKRLQSNQNLCEKKQISNEEKNQQNKEVCLSCLRQLSQMTSFECIDKGNALKLCLEKIIQVLNFLNRNFQRKIDQNLNKAIFNEQKMQARYIERIQQLQTEVGQNRKLNQNKWKSFYMMVKDNRVLRRQNGKLQRRLKEECIKVRNLQQKIIKNEKQIQKDRLLLRCDEASFDEIERFITNRRNLNKLQKVIDKYPAKAAKVLKTEMQKLQTVEMNTLDQKIDFVTKAINDVQDIYGEYQDCVEQQLDRKILFNVRTQTEFETYSRGINTNQISFTNSSANTKICQIKLFRNIVSYFYDPQFKAKHVGIKRTVSINQSVIQQEHHRVSKMSKKFNQKKNSNNGSDILREDSRRPSRKTSKIGKLGNSLSPGLKFKRSSSYILNDGFQQIISNQLHFKNRQLEQNIQSNVYSLIIYPSMNLIMLQNMDFLKVNKQSSEKLNRNSQIVILKSHYYKKKSNAVRQSKQNCQMFDPVNYLRVQNQVYDYSINPFPNNSNNLTNASAAKGQKRGSKMQYIIPNRNSINIYKNSVQFTKEESSLMNLMQNLSKSSQKSIQSNTQQTQKSIIRNSFKKNVKTQSNQFNETTKMKKVGMRRSMVKNVSIKQIQERKQNIMQVRDVQTRQKQKNIDIQRLSKQSQVSNLRKSVRRQTHAPQVSNFLKLHRKKTQCEQFRASVRLTEIQNIKKRQYKQISQNKLIESQLRNLTSRETLRAYKNEPTQNLHDQIQFPKAPILPLVQKNSKQETESIRKSQFKRYDTRPSQFQKTIKKIIKGLLQRKNELINSNLTMNEFLKSQFQFLYGPKNSLQSFLTTLGDIKYQKFSMIMSFQIMLSLSSTQFYLQDLFKIYIMMIQKAGNSDVFDIQKQRACEIIEYIFLKYFDPSKFEDLKDVIPCWIEDKVDLHDCFIPITLFLQDYSIKCELYAFLTDILPPNQGDLSYQQLSELVGLFKGKADFSQHLFRLKIMTKNQRLPFHRLCLYCHNRNWTDLLNIQSYIQKTYCQFRQQFNYEDTIRKYKRKPLKNFPWIKSLIDQMADNYFLYGKPVRPTFLQFLQILQSSEIIQSGFPFSENLEFIGKCYDKTVLKQQLINGIY